MPTCCDCHNLLDKSAFAKSQLKKPASSRRCLACASAWASAFGGSNESNAATCSTTAASCKAASADSSGKASKGGGGKKHTKASPSSSASDGGIFHSPDNIDWVQKLREGLPPVPGDGGFNRDGIDLDAASSQKTRTERARAPRVGGAAAGGATPPIEPGRKAIVRNLKGRTELNGTGVTIVKTMPNGRVAVEVTRLPGTSLASTETVAIKPENLEVVWGELDTGIGGQMRNWGMTPEECPICMDTLMNIGQGPGQTASTFACCGGRICHQCFIKMQLKGDKNARDTCPLCRADTSDCSDAAELKRIQARADRGDASAMYNLGGYYDYGRMGLRQDQALARVWYERSARKGHSRAANNLACSHRDGEGGPVDRKEAAKWFRVAAEMGHVQSATNLGLALMRGDGVKRDLKEAEMWLKKSAAAGDELAKQQLEYLNLMKSGGGDGDGRGRGASNVTCTPFGSGGNVMFSFGR